MKNEPVLYEANPAMFRNHPIWFVISLLLCVAVIGIPIVLIWWLKCKGTKLTVTSERTLLREGILAKSINEVWHRDVRNVRVKQTFLQRVFGVGEIEISSAGQSGVEIDVKGVPSPYTIRELVDKHRR